MNVVLVMELFALISPTFFWHLFTFYHEISLGCSLTSQDKSHILHFSQFPTVPSTVVDKIIEQLHHWFGKCGPHLIF